MKAVKQDASQLQNEVDFWYKEALIAQEMLAQVLVSVYDQLPVVEVPKGRSLPEGVGIQVLVNEDKGVVTFELAKVDAQGNKVGDYEPAV